jgi:hypothetical protein
LPVPARRPVRVRERCSPLEPEIDVLFINREVAEGVSGPAREREHDTDDIVRVDELVPPAGPRA